MTCEKRGGMVVCSRDTKNRCYICGAPSVALCDATKKDGTPCDLPMCEKHRNRVGDDIDICQYHNYPKYIKQAKENRAKREEARKYFIEEYQKQNFRVVPGHWPDFATKEEVDKWIDMQKKMLAAAREFFDKD